MAERVAILTLMMCAVTAHRSSAADASSDVFLTLDEAVRVRVGWGVPQSNASLSGKDMSIGTKSFGQGVTLHAPAELVYRLEKKYRWLSFWTGINSEMTEKGSVTVQVWLGGQKAFETPVMRVKEEPVYVHLPIAGVAELKLVVTDAGDGIAADHLSIANLRVSAAEQEPKPDVRAAAVFVGVAPAPAESPLSLWYRRPARRWLEALSPGFADMPDNRTLITQVFSWQSLTTTTAVGSRTRF